MILLYNNTTDTFKDLYRHPYENIDEYVSPVDVEALEYDVLFFTNLTDAFIIAKRRSAIRGRFAKNKDGTPLIESIALTDDERDWYDDILPAGASEVFKKLSAFAKKITYAYKYGVTFGGKVAVGTVESVVGTVVTDSALVLTPSALKNHKFVITSDNLLKDQEQTILDNTVNTITLTLPWEQDITGMSFSVYNPAEDYILYTVKMDSNWDTNMLHNCESAIMEALVSYTLKEWYMANRYVDEYAIEQDKYQKNLLLVKSSLGQGMISYRRPTDFFSL